MNSPVELTSVSESKFSLIIHLESSAYAQIITAFQCLSPPNALECTLCLL